MQLLEFGTHREVMLTDDQRRMVVYREQPLSIAEFFVAYTAMKGGCGSSTGVASQTSAEPAPQPAPATANSRPLDPAKARNVLDDPLLHHEPGGSRMGRNVGIRLATGKGVSLGQYTDYHDARRTLPRLCGASICGILQQPGSLDPTVTPSDASLRETARASGDYRRKLGIGGFDCGPEAAELYIRIFRAIGLTAPMLPSFEPDRLVALYKAYLVCHGAAE